jgi:3-hydroxybutyryl-CoA dehydratase
LLLGAGSIKVRRNKIIALQQPKSGTMALEMVDGPGRRAWDELHGYYIEDLVPGMTALYARTVTDADIVLFAGISGDSNPVHLNHEFAAGTMFEGRIAHGMLTASFISTVLGTKLPGPGCIYLSQSLKFKAPVRSGDTVNARVTVVDVVPSKGRVTLLTVCMVANEVVLEGEAQVIVPARAAA